MTREERRGWTHAGRLLATDLKETAQFSTEHKDGWEKHWDLPGTYPSG